MKTILAALIALPIAYSVTTFPAISKAVAAEAYLLIRHKVADYDTWRAAYDAHESVRMQYGQESALVMRDASDPSMVSILIGFPSADKADAFSKDKGLPEAMKDAGVEGPPELHIMTNTD